MRKKNENSRENSRQPMGRKTKRAMAVYAALVLMMTAGATTVYAASDPLAVISSSFQAKQIKKFCLRTI